MDRITKDQRSWNMSRIRSKNTKPETIVRKYLYSKGIRYRLHADLPGRPDIVVKRRNTAVFINGCFWHGHDECKHFRLPKTRVEYWDNKISRNIERDKRNYLDLALRGWCVLVVWECELKQNLDETLNRLYGDITSQNS